VISRKDEASKSNQETRLKLKKFQMGANRGVVELERVGMAFPHHFAVLLKNEFEAVSKWLVFWVRSHTFFVNTTSLGANNSTVSTN